MLGPRGTPEDAFTYRAVQYLSAAYPDAHVTLVVRTARAALASDMLATLKAALAAERYPLVFWQAGTVEAVHNVPVEVLASTLREGGKLVAAAHGSLILIDPQFSRLLQSKADVAPYETAMREVAGAPEVALFHRYDLTREWATSGRIDLEHAAVGERQVVADHLNDCLARALAGLAREERESPAAEH